ncbi:MAG: hypothetical protein KF787_06140 [Phycisphaeraceae bacterium]|nr:hypothetical protein [Phycisphaerae bacterium]MBX3392210.1 hypothetical protein [Phycisphaeraceae bacterium]HRJ48921.1 hypothetical protein [Phycisphaerales bacterium]
MFLKLAVCVVAMCVFGCALLAMRQARLQAAHELAQTQLRIRTSDERLFKLRTQIGANVRPEDVRSLVSESMSLRPIVPGVEAEPGLPAVVPAPGEPSGRGTMTSRPSNTGGSRSASGVQPLLAYDPVAEDDQ